MRKVVKREVKELGEVRSSQLITSYGVGAIVDFRNETAILGGADDWYRDPEKDEGQVLHCHNLEKILGKQFFVRPRFNKKQNPVYKRSYSHDIGAYRFPSMLYCPSCTFLFHESEISGAQKGELHCPNCRSRLVPSRFIVVCRHGHIDDFPYSKWVHRGQACEKQTDGKHPRLKLFNVNNQTNLGSLMVACEECKKIRSMHEAFVSDALSAVYQCAGRYPWLEIDDYHECAETAVARMRSATGVYMPVNISALNIPPWSTNISKVLAKHLDALEGKNAESLKAYIQKKVCPALPGVSIGQILNTYSILASKEYQEHPSTLKELYEEEYKALCEEEEDEKADFSARKMSIPNKYRDYICSISAIDRLTEVVAMVGFTRLQAWNGDLDSPCIAPVFSRDPGTWLPAVDMHGEGIFIRLNEEKVESWERKNEHIYKQMMDNVKKSSIHCENASARYVLLHTLSHLLIRSLAKLCGYQTSSLKERVYSTYPNGEKMAGILVYTASSDSEGSLGGLVAQAGPEHIAENLDALLEEAEWCSGDPLCMISTGANAQGIDGLNYAACHQCALLPETSCTMRNVLLDRAALIGREDDGTIGFFSPQE